MKKSTSISIGVASLVCANAYAGVLIGNLPLGNENGTPTLNYSASTYRTVGFQNGATGADLQSVRIVTSDTTGWSTTVAIYSAVLNEGEGIWEPNASLFNTFTPSFSGNTVTLIPTGTFNVAANQRYFVVVSGGTTDNWLYSDPETPYIYGPGVSGLGVGINNGGSGWTMGAGQRPGLELTVVPEPHQYAAIAGLGLIGFAFLRRRFASK